MEETTKKTTYNTNPLRMFSFTIQGENAHLEDMLEELLTQKDTWEQAGITYLKAAKEFGGDTDNVHYHIFVHTNKGQRYSYFNALLTEGKPDIIDCKILNIKQTLEYIGNTDFVYSENHSTKEKRGKKKGGIVEKVWEIGDVKTVKIPRAGTYGNDTDARLIKLQDMIKDGASLDQLYEADFPAMVKHGRNIESYLAVYYGAEKQQAQVSDLKAAAKMREAQNARAENRALLEMMSRLQDRIVELEGK